MGPQANIEEMIGTSVQKMGGEAKVLDATVDMQQKGILFIGWSFIYKLPPIAGITMWWNFPNFLLNGL